MNEVYSVNVEEWTQVPVYRGIDAISHILDICDIHGGKVMGGFARYACSPLSAPPPPSDIDLFPVGRGGATATYERLLRSLAQAGFRLVYESRHGLVFDHPPGVDKRSLPKCQLIKPGMGSLAGSNGDASTVLGGFDFSIVRVAIDKSRVTGTASPLFLQDELDRRLRLMNISTPVGSAKRIVRYVAKGYRIDAVEIMKIFLDWDQRPDHYKKTEVEQAMSAAARNLQIDRARSELKLASPFRPDRAVSTDWMAFPGHQGVDFDAPSGTAVYSPVDGVVGQTESSVDGQRCTPGFGNHITIQSGEYEVILAHLNQGIRVRAGQEVTRGTLLGFVGNSGGTRSRSSGYNYGKGGGYHLHLEIRVNGHPIDPLRSPHLRWGG